MKIRSILAIVLLCAGCASDPVEMNAAGPGQNDTIFVVGVEPEQTRVMVIKGTLQDGVFYRTGNYHFYDAKDGFIIGHIQRGTTVGIISLGLRGTEAVPGFFGAEPHDYEPCKNARALAFSAPAGKVIYLTNIYGVPVHKPDGNKLEVTFKPNFESARGYVKAHYPKLAKRLEQGPYTLAPYGNCQKS